LEVGSDASYHILYSFEYFDHSKPGIGVSTGIRVRNGQGLGDNREKARMGQHQKGAEDEAMAALEKAAGLLGAAQEHVAGCDAAQCGIRGLVVDKRADRAGLAGTVALADLGVAG
jgi:hypothetical protein